MEIDNFARQIRDTQRRAIELLGRANGSSLQEKDLLVEAFEEFYTTLEELNVAEEELRSANEEMAAAREVVEAERQRYQDMFEFALDAYVVTDIKGKIQEANRAAAGILNVSQRFLVGKPLFIFLAEEVRDDFLTKLNQLQQLNQEKEWEVRLHPRNSAPLHATLNVAAIRKWQHKPIELCWLLRDITKRKQAEEALRQQTEREQALNRFTSTIRRTLHLETIFTTAVQEISQLLRLDYVGIQQYLSSHQVWLTVAEARQRPDLPSSLGIEVPDVENEITRQLKRFEVARINDTNTLEDAISRKISQMYPGAWLLVPLHFQDCLWGSLCLMISRVHHWSNSEVELIKAIAIQLAIAIQQAQLYKQVNVLNTDLECQVQERTLELQQKIEELQEMNTLKDDFLNTVSHELRTPMTNMKMAIQMLKIAAAPERQQRYLDILQTECDREIDLINDLLDLQRLQAESYPLVLTEAINLQDWLLNFIVPFRSRASDRHLFLTLDISPNLPPLISNCAGLERILAELLNNACKYTPAGGKLNLRVCHEGREESSSGFSTVFTVSNQAEIPAAALLQIFEKFYRVPNADPWKQGGTGLGLALVQKLVEQLGGSIQVESSNGWTYFTVQFPS